MNYKQTVAKNLKQIRKQKQLTQTQVAVALGKFDQNSLSCWETGCREPDLNTVGLLADYYGISIDYLFGRENYTSALRKL